MRCSLLFLLLLLCQFPARAQSELQSIRYPAVATMSDFRSEYPIALLQLALKKAGVAAELQSSAEPMSKSRALQRLKSSKGIDVVWTMTSTEREEQYLPVRVPIYRGLGSYRLLLIQKEQQAMFSQLKNNKSMQQLRFAQVHDWVDTEILRHNKFSILAVSQYENLFQMLLKGRVDAIPRGVLEIEAEAESYQQQGLVIETDWLIYYPGAVYFFVEKNNIELAAQIEQGLRLAIADGSFLALFQQFFARHLQNMRLEERRLIRLSNPFLPAQTPLHDSTLWYQPGPLR